MQSTFGASTSSTSDAGYSSRHQTAESSGMATHEVDQLLSSDSDDISVTRSRVDAQVASGSSSSAVVSGTSSGARQQDPSLVPVSSPSLRKILHPPNIESFQQSSPGLESQASSAAVAQVSRAHVSSGTSPPAPEPLADYTCPICFFPPTNATLTPCGHICCGACLFMAVKSALQRGNLVNNADANVARCPVCRAPIPGWDGRGGGVIGLKARSLLTL
ncbi:hypothetical protein C0992_009925 [Termitomyces sp. T32_za158]|nr:hypothetical protein C0992_009925 [Termitomyces sp. T32_za158]